MLNFITRTDSKIISTMKVLDLPLARFGIFVVYFWFGILKLFGTSPANPLVDSLLAKTLPFMTFDMFIILLGIYEIIIGITFLIPKKERLAIALLIPHLFVTTMPLILLPTIAWQSFFVPTLEGQYIIKNILIIVVAMEIAASLKPMRARR